MGVAQEFHERHIKWYHRLPKGGCDPYNEGKTEYNCHYLADETDFFILTVFIVLILLSLPKISYQRRLF